MSKTEFPYKSVHLSVIDGVGCGEAVARRPQYPRDQDANSLVHASRFNPLNAPTLLSLGLHQIHGLENLQTATPKPTQVKGAYGSMTPTFAGNGSTEGHQALMGHIVEDPYLVFNETGFPPQLISLVESTIEAVLHRPVKVIRYPDTDDINGVAFINHPTIGPAHVASHESTGPLLIPMYASTDSVVQIALHQGIVPQPQIEAIGKAVRAALNEHHFRVARVIMRPFKNSDSPDRFERISADRRDYGVDPDQPTLINYLAEAGIPVFGLGKAPAMLNYAGFQPDHIHKLGTDEERMQAIVADFADHQQGPHFSFDNLIGTDELYGHTRKPAEYIDHIGMLDRYIAQGILAMADDGLWILTSDHGNDPTQNRHTNHTNEHVPVVIASPRFRRPIEIGVRPTYADLAKTIADIFGVADQLPLGTSFLRRLALG